MTGMFSGSRLREARHRAGLTQDELAWQARTSQRNIVRWEHGHTRPRSADIVERLAAATGQPIDYFNEPAVMPDTDTAAMVADLLAALRPFVDQAVDRAVKERTAA